MKKHFKIISLLSLFVIASTTFFIFAKRPADDKPETVIVKVFGGSNLGKSLINVYYGNNKIEETKAKLNDIPEAELEIIQKMNNLGYKVISHSEYSMPSSIITVNETWVLTLK